MNDSSSENIKPVISRSSPNPLSIPVAILLGAVLVSGAILYVGKNNSNILSSNTTSNTASNTSPSVTPSTGQPVTVSIAKSPIKGSSSAKVSLVVFEDFQCPYCEQFTSQMLPTIISKYVDTNKISLIYEYLPLTSIHQYAAISAQAGACAAQQGDDKFWALHDSLFNNQSAWTSAADQAGAITLIKQYASAISGLDMDKFNSCLSGTEPSIISTDSSQASSLGITGTPAFIVGTRNGDTVHGTSTIGVPSDISTLENLIDQAISG